MFSPLNLNNMGFFDSLLKLGTSGVLGAAGSLISGGMSMIGQNSNIDKQIKAQAAENDRFRQYSTELAEKQNQWNIDQWNRENEYNDPSQVRNRFINAGFNPNLIAGSISGQSVSSAVGSGTSGSDVSQDMSPLGQKMTTGQMLQQALQNEAAMAQISNIKADTNKKNQEAKGQGFTNEVLKSDAAFRDAVNSGIVELNNANIEFTAKQSYWIDYMKPAEIANLRASTNHLNMSATSLIQGMRESQAKVNNLNADTRVKNKQANWYDQDIQSVIRQRLASASMSYAQARLANEEAKNIAEYMLSQTKSNNALIKVYDEQAKEIGAATLKYNSETEMLDIQIQNIEDYKDVDKFFQYLNGTIGAAGEALQTGLLYKALGARGAATVKGFSGR